MCWFYLFDVFQLDESLGSLNNTFITLSSTSLSADIVLVCSVNEYVEIVDMPAKANELMGTVKILQGLLSFFFNLSGNFIE
jgi:hypothetical protein